ncbi:hypothetical protein HPULCUR_012066 [Helicostylum pulchrum]|uniref:Importin-13 n=1 Tax=Helicostylum pulchrum TaxID=562976 RepID=A0ABP9YI63_9FUNG
MESPLQLIGQLYSSSDVNVTKLIQEQLQSLQKQPYAWEIASQLLGSQSEQCRFFGAHTFQVKITRDWDTLPEDRIDWLRDELLGWTVRLCGGPLFVTTKLCLALIAYAFHTVPDQWPHFITATVDALQVGSHAYGVPNEPIQLAILEFFTLVPEEVANANIMGGKKLQLIGELKESIPLVLSKLSEFLFSNTDVFIQKKAMRCLQSWIQYGFDLEAAYPLLQKVMSLLGDEVLFEPAVEVLLESMQQTSWTRYQTYRNDLLACFTSDDMKLKFTVSITEEDEETGKLLAKLFTGFGETYTDYIATQLAEPKLNDLMSMIIQLTGYQGYFPIDQEVSEIPLNFWYVLQETLFDESILPVKETDTWRMECGQTAMGMYRELVKILIKNARYPEEDVWNTWDKDVKDKFKIWRRDLGDTMINPYYILREEMLSILLDHSLYIITQWSSLPFPSQDLEATLFCLKSISEEISPTEDQHIAKFFAQNVLGGIRENSSVRLKNTVLLLIGSLSEWLKVHPQFLGSVMNYIAPCLSDLQLAPAASSAFADICDACREYLVDELDSLMHVYAAMANSNIKSNIMQKVVESVAGVIQVLPPDRAMSPLMTLTGDILQGISKAMESDRSHARDAVLVQLHYLAACCRGIQSPNDDYQSLTERNSVYDSYASGRMAQLYSTVEGFNEITFAIRESSIQIASAWGTDEEIAKALSHFLELGMKSTSPLLSLNFGDLASLLESSYGLAPFACWLDTASFMMTVYGGQTTHFERLRDLLFKLTTKTLEFIQDTEAMEHYPDVVDSYFGLISRTIRRCPLAFYRLPQNMIHTIFMFVIAGMGLQERLALKSALNFMADFVSQDYEEVSEIAKIVDTMMMNMGMQIMEQLLMGIGGRVPRSFSGPLIDVLYKMIGKYMQPCRQWLHTLLATDGFPSMLVTPNDKETFLKGVLGGLGNTSFDNRPCVSATLLLGIK